MNKIRTKVISSEIGKFDVDSITVNLNGEITGVCFDKKDSITQYDGKEIYLINTDGVYTVEPYVEENFKVKK